ncbi:IS701 family transposase [Streptomyces sp. MUM 178J]|uniref:IS701 family transposase n=1 Tax=Streptomyces sp. MUM 178J TaxID=2791991 RepID=UPI001F04CEA2|nr:transposase [Streptomyces sp. MUM 178J]WRQ82833.1 transposase [Streptomyces sp. MUM 178J]
METKVVRVDSRRAHGVPEAIVGEVCSELFAGLARKDQRCKGEQYLRGLLTAQGRKSIRNIAASVGDGAAEQSLHHFISASTWDWTPVRAALARYLERVMRPRCWVVQNVVIPKAGQHSVGVTRRFVPSLGHIVNSQEAYGVWAANEEMSSPVSWRLRLSAEWLRQCRSGVPGHPAEQPATTSLACVTDAVRQAQSWIVGPPRPVVLDLPESDPSQTARGLRAAGLPFLMAVHGTTRVTAADPALAGTGIGEVSVQQLLRVAGPLRRPVTWTDPETRRLRTSLVTALRVELPAAGPVLLLGEWGDPRGWPRKCWITDLSGAAWGDLLRLAQLTRRVETDFNRTSVNVGVVDFEGRSFDGWHRHTTLASAAQAVQTLATADGRVRAVVRPVAQPLAQPA